MGTAGPGVEGVGRWGEQRTCHGSCPASRGPDACRIYGPDTGVASGQLVLGVAIFGLSGCTLETIYSPRALGTSGGVTLVTLKSPQGLAILENIFD